MEDGLERPIAYASCSLSQAKNNYTQLDKGTGHSVWSEPIPPLPLWQEVSILSDHKPLKHIFSEIKAFQPWHPLVFNVGH